MGHRQDAHRAVAPRASGTAHQRAGLAWRGSVGGRRDSWLSSQQEEPIMCLACENPDWTRADYLQHLHGVIALHGWAVQGVERDRFRPPWAYTVGLTGHHAPELVVTGMPVRRAAGLLNDVAAHVLHAAAPAPGEQVQLEDGPLIEFVAVAQPSAHLVMAVEMFGAGVRALQVLHADDRGHWPWDRGFRGGRGGQPVLGARAPEAA
jgi:hypothetical protein